MIVHPKSRYKNSFYEASAPVFFSDYAKKVSMITGHSVEDIMEIISVYFLVCLDEFLKKTIRKVDPDDKARREWECIVPGFGTLLFKIQANLTRLGQFAEFRPTTQVRNILRRGFFEKICPLEAMMDKQAKDIMAEKKENIVIEEKKE